MTVPQNRLDQIRDLVNQWEQLSGYAVSVSDWMINDMAALSDFSGMGPINSLFQLGQYMRWYSGSASWQSHPIGGVGQWAWYGLSAAEYNTKVEAFDSTFQQLTGQNVPQDLIDRALSQHQGTMTGGQFQTWLLSQDNIKNTYGWLKYGLDFQQFQQQKLTMNSTFGRELTDAEAITQLQYLHQAQGANVAAGVQPTLSQVEKKSAQTGIGQSEVR